MRIIIISLLILCMVFLVGCEEIPQCVSNSDCNNSQICYDDGSYQHIKYCKDVSNFYQKVDMNTSKGYDPFSDNNTYCYPDNSKSNICRCDILTFPDGHNETKNCHCVNDLVMHYTCINTSNVTITKGVDLIK